MISFYPGPSKTHSEISGYLNDAVKDGILSVNHRSQSFMDLFAETAALLKDRLCIPENYHILFASSATECWEILAQSLVKGQSFHLFNGAFGEKWFQHAYAIKPGAVKHYFKPEKEITPAHFIVPGLTEMIAITQNETSNGTQVPVSVIEKIRKQYRDKLIAIDATSSLGGISLPIEQADIWYASVQKCFGLPAGMAVLLLSPKAVKAAMKVKDRDHFNSLLNMVDQAKKNQTVCTPNVLNIYLLNRVLKKSDNINLISEKLKMNASRWYQMLSEKKNARPLTKTKAVQSDTVICVASDALQIELVKAKAEKSGFLIGNGYGKLAGSTFRIANFPAHDQTEIDELMHLIDNVLE